MKGAIASCTADLVKTKFGEETWKDILEESGLSRNKKFLATEDVPDEAVMKVIKTICKKLDASLQEVADMFGEHWVCEYAPDIYSVYYIGIDSAKEFLLQMDDIHVKTTNNIENAHPPRFEYEWEDDNTLLMKYESERDLIEILAGLIRGVGTYFEEDLDVEIKSREEVEVVFN